MSYEAIIFSVVIISFVFFTKNLIDWLDQRKKSKDLKRFGGGRPGTASSVVVRSDNLSSGKKAASPQARTL